MNSVFLIDDHPVVAMGLGIALAEAATLRLVGVATDAKAGLETLRTLRRDCLVLDLIFGNAVVLSNIAQARAILPCGTIVVFSSLPARAYACDALAAGADAYLGKDADMGELAALLARHAAGLPPDAAAPLPEPDHATIDGVHLTRRERQIAAAIGRGLPNATIAAALELSPNTIATHRENMRKKLHCRDSKALVARLSLLLRPERRGA